MSGKQKGALRQKRPHRKRRRAKKIGIME